MTICNGTCVHGTEEEEELAAVAYLESSER